MTKSKRRQGLSGTVLIMVLTVMVILIIMLMATLTVVTTAGQRIYTKYEENQAYYTARSALDVYTNNMLNDSAYIAYSSSGKKTFSYTKDDGTTDTTDMKQGLALQLDLYKIKSQGKTALEDYGSATALGLAENAVFGDGTFVTSSPEDTNYTLSDATGLPYIEYDVKLPAVTDKSSNKYGKMVDIDKNDEDGDGDTTDQIARIKIEVLDRKYAMNPTYDDDVIERVLKGTPNAGDPSVADIKTAIQNGERSKDYMKLKITSTVKLMDTEGVAIVIIETTEKQTPATDNAITATGDVAGGSGAMVRAAGGLSTLDAGTVQIGDGNNTSGSLFTAGSFKWTSSASNRLNGGDTIVAMDGIAYSSNPVMAQSAGDNSFVFCGGVSSIYKGQIGDTSHNVDFIADTVSLGGDNGFTVYGNAYVNTLDLSGQLGNDGSGNPLGGVSNPGKFSATGSFYVQNLVLPSSCFGDFNGDGTPDVNFTLCSSTNIKLCSNFTVTNASTNDVYKSVDMNSATSTTKWESWENGSFLATATFNSTYSSSTTTGFNIDSFTPVTKDGKIYRQYSIPFQVNGQNLIEVPTAQAYFAKYFKDNAFHDISDGAPLAGELRSASAPTNNDPTDAVNAHATLYSQANKSAWQMTGADMLADYLKLADLPAGATPRTITSVMTEASKVADPMPTGTVTINLDSGDKFYVLDKTSYSGCQWTVTGTNGRLILLLPEGQNVDFNNCLLMSDQITDSTTSITNGVTEAPRVDIYGGTGANISTQNNCLFAAYFIMPTATIDEFKMGKQGISYSDGNGLTVPVQQLAIAGSVLCQKFVCLNNATGVVYIGKDSGGAEPGEPHLAVQSVKYTRND